MKFGFVRNVRSMAVAGSVAALFASSAALAQDGTVEFNGLVTAQTCTVDSPSGAAAVALGTVQASTLYDAGVSAQSTPFAINLSNCTPSSGNVRAYFEMGPTIDMTNGTLINDGTATNVNLQLQQNDGTPINVTQNGPDQGSPYVAINAGAASLPYRVRYIATGPATAGTVHSSVQFTVNYQ